MAFNDNKLGTLFPVRTGGPTGTANERQMLDHMGGAGTVCKAFRTNADGSVTMAHTRGVGSAPEFITNRPENLATTCSLEMDSGIVDMMGMGNFDPNAELSGKVYQTDYVQGHVFSATTATGAGKLNYPSLAGNVVPNGSDAKAFSNTFSGGTDFKTRKEVATRIPPSLFTGRMRLYVQSLYGGNWPLVVLADASGGVGRPVLSINLRSRESGNLPPVYVGSGSGIFFDTTTKCHFLILPDADKAYVMPLVSTTCANKYRELLLANTLSIADQERVEAYILSQSFPDAGLTQVLEYESTPNESLGYSWHFNWDGNKCDIIDVKEVFISGPNVYGFETTHYRLEFTNLGAPIGANFSVARSVVAGPNIWTVPKDQNVIAYPDWIFRNLTKAGGKPSGRTDVSQSGEVYCFYAKNDLRTVTMSASPGAVTGSTNYNPPTLAFGLLETQDGETTQTSAWSGYSCTFSSGGVTVGGMSGNSSRNRSNTRWAGRDAASYWDNVENPYPAGSTVYQNVGVPQVTLGGGGQGFSLTYDQVSITAPSITPPPGYTIGIARYLTNGYWDFSYDVYTTSRTHNTLMVIPFNDAEAVFLSDHVIEQDSGTRYSGTQYKYNSVGEFDLYVIGGASSGRHVVYSFATNSLSEVGVQTSAPFTQNNTSGSKQLHCSNGVFSVPVMPSEGSFYSTAEFVTQLYPTLSSVNGAVNAYDNGVQAGSPTFPHLSSYLGWA